MKINEKNKKILTVFAIVGLIVLTISGMFVTGIVKPQTTELIVIDTRGTGNSVKWILLPGDVIAQKIVVPANVIYLRQAMFDIVIHDGSSSLSLTVGLSSTLNVNPSSWLSQTTAQILVIPGINVMVPLERTVTAGQTYYIMMKLSTQNRYVSIFGCVDSSYPGGTTYISENGGSFQAKSADMHFGLQAIEDLGATFQVTSASANPSAITVGQSSTFTAVITSPTGGSCNVILYKNYDTGVVWNTQAVTFAANEQRTITVTKTGISPAGTYYMAFECNINGEEEAHKSFTLSVAANPNHAPTTPILTGDNSLEIGETGHWSAVSSDSDGNTIKYTWKLDGSVVKTSSFMASGLPDSYSRSFSSEGIHTFSVKAEDTGGLSSGWATRDVEVNQQQSGGGGDGGDNPPEGFSVEVSVVNQQTYAAIDGATTVLGSYTKTTNGQGISTFNAIPFGTYSVRASKTGFVTKSQNVVVNTDVTATIYLVPTEQGGGGDENPPPGEDQYTLTIEAYDDGTNLPIAGVHVTINSETFTTNSEGKATATVTAGLYATSLTKTGYVSDNMDITISNSNKVISFYLVKSVSGGNNNGTGGGTGNKTPGFEALTFVAAIGISFSLVIWRKRRKE